MTCNFCVPGRGKIGPLNNAQGCRFTSNTGRHPRSTNLHAHCRSCNTTIEWNIASSRMIAIMKLPANDLWKGVVTRKSYPSKYIFEGSGRRNVSTHRGQCLTLEHLNLETYRPNARRKSHHKGIRLCDCYKPCICPNVRTCPEGGHTGMRLEWLE
jgi:hypothetical protein